MRKIKIYVKKLITGEVTWLLYEYSLYYIFNSVVILKKKFELKKLGEKTLPELSTGVWKCL
jgi:choline-glycine betaine transporter